MPGIIGFTRREGDGDRTTLDAMQKMLRHQPFYVEDPVFSDPHVLATRTHKAIVQMDVQPIVREGIHVWLKGEFYNQHNLATRTSHATQRYPDAALLLHLYEVDKQFRFLERIDGIFSAVIYDSNSKSIHLITDRYGIGYLYWTVVGGALLWASEMKAFLAYPRFHAKIDPQTLAEFFRSGYPPLSKTWFDGVELVPSGTVLTWRIKEERLQQRKYWSWSDIQPLQEPIYEEEITEEIGQLWLDSVRRRSTMGDNRIGLSLSGGRDSRAILAAMPELKYPIHAITIGDARCDDVRIARRAANLKGATHHVFDLNGTNWLNLRTDAVWWSDGHLNLKHMHGCVTINKARELYDINLSGIVALIGGTYVGREADILSTRGRRFAPCHVQAIDDVFFHSRLPFLDNAFVERVLAVPGKYRMNHSLYERMLLSRFPSFYRSIPWQETGLPIGESSPFRQKIRHLSKSVRRSALRAARKLGVENKNSVDHRRFHNYEVWLREEPARQFIDKILTNPNRLYPEYIDGGMVLDDWKSHLAGRNLTNQVCQALTFEIWLQQVYEGAYRSVQPAPIQSLNRQ